MNVSKPNLFLVGAPKCGTTSLHNYLGQHPGIFMSDPKEPHYFSTDLQWRFQARPFNTEASYLKLFEDAAGYSTRGEASVWYLYSKVAAQQVYDFNPDAKIVIALRNPVEMVYSLFRFAVKNGSETIRSFRDALAAEPARTRGENLPAPLNLRTALLYRDAASFAGQVERYMSLFDRSQVRVVLFDDLADKPQQVCSDLFEFLGQHTDAGIDLEPRNVTAKLDIERVIWLRRRFPRQFHFASKLISGWPKRAILGALNGVCPKPVTINEPMASDMRAELRDYFRPDVKRLSQIIQRDLSHWYR